MPSLDDIPTLPPANLSGDDMIAVIDGSDRRSPRQATLSQLGSSIVSPALAADPAGAVTALDASTGGNGAADAGKLAKYDSRGSLLLGSSSTPAGGNSMLTVTCSTGVAIQGATTGVGGFAFEAGMQGAAAIGYSTHFGTAGSQTGLAVDGTSGSVTDVGVDVSTPGRVIVGRDESANETWAVYGAGHMLFWEMTAPAAPGANRAHLYLEDNGAGKSRLMVKFATGAAQQVAIQP